MRSLTVETVFANGRRYKEEYLLRHNDHWFFMKAEREDDWLGGLRFFLNRVLYQGRNDGVSKRVYDGLSTPWILPLVSWVRMLRWEI